MKVALIGAGFVGTPLLHELTSRKHQVKVIVRHPEKVAAAGEGVTIVKGDVYDTAGLSAAFKGYDAVINAFNAGWTNPNLYNDFLTGSNSIQQATKDAGVKRYISVGGAGSLYLPDGTQLVDSPQFPAEYKAGATAARDYLNILKTEQQLDWTFLSPAIEMHPGTSGVRTGKYNTGLENPVFNAAGRSYVSVEDIAVAIVDELENAKHIRQRFTIGY